MIVFSALVCPNPPSWQCEVRRDRLERFAEDLGLPLGQPFDLNRAVTNRWQRLDQKNPTPHRNDTAGYNLQKPLKAARPDRWRDVQNIDHAVGVYHISEAPLSEEDWIEEHASNAKQLELEAAPVDANGCYPLANTTEKKKDD